MEMKPSPTKSQNLQKQLQIHNFEIKISPRKNNIFHPDFFFWQDMNLYVRLRTVLAIFGNFDGFVQETRVYTSKCSEFYQNIRKPTGGNASSSDQLISGRKFPPWRKFPLVMFRSETRGEFSPRLQDQNLEVSRNSKFWKEKPFAAPWNWKIFACGAHFEGKILFAVPWNWKIFARGAHFVRWNSICSSLNSKKFARGIHL